MNALKSIFGSIHSSKAISEIEKLGVAVYKFSDDGKKQFRNVENVLVDVMLATQDTTQNVENLFKAMAGGKWQWNKMGAIVDYKEFITALDLSLNSRGMAAQQVAMQMDTLVRKFQTLQNELARMSASSGGLREMLKDILDFLTGVIRFINNMPATTGHILAAIAGVKVAYEVIRKLITVFTSLRTSVAAATTATTAFGVATRLASLSNPILAMLSLVTIAWGAYESATNKASDAMSKAEKEMGSLGTQLEMQSAELESIDKNVGYIDTLIGALRTLNKQYAETEDLEKRKKLNDEIQLTEKTLAKITSEAAVENMKSHQYNEESVKSEKEAYEKSKDSIRGSLNDIQLKIIETSKAIAEQCDEQIKSINNEAEAFDKAADAIGAALGKIDEYRFRLRRWESGVLNDYADNLEKENAMTTDAKWSSKIYDVTGIEYFKDRAERNSKGPEEFISILREAAKQNDQAADDIKNNAITKIQNDKIAALKPATNLDRVLGNSGGTGVGGNDLPGGDTPKDKGSTAEKSDKDYAYDGESSVSYNDLAFQEAVNRIGIPYELGGNGVDSTDCGKLILDAYTSAGINFANRYVPDMMQEAIDRGAWHYGDSDYVPQKGDAAVVLGKEHVVMADGNGGYVGASSGRGAVIHKDSLTEDFGNVTGYISVNDLTGGAKVSRISANTHEQQQNNWLKMLKDYDFTKAKLSADTYERTLSNLSMRQSLYGDTIMGTIDKQNAMRERMGELNKESGIYQGRIDSLTTSIDSFISNNGSLQKSLHVTKEEWDALTKDEKRSFRLQRKDILDADKALKNLTSTLNDYSEKASATKKEINALSNELLKSNFEGVFDQDKIFQRRGEDIDRNTRMKKNGMDTYTDPDYREQMRKIDHEAALEKQRLATERVTKAEKEYAAALATIPAIVETKTAALAAAREELSKLDPASEAYARTERKIIDLTNELASAQAGVTNQTIQAKESLDKEKLALSDAGVEVRKYADKFQEIREKGADVFSRLIVDGQSWHDIMKELWADFAKDAIRRLFQVQNAAQQTSLIGGLIGGGGGILGMIGGLFGGGVKRAGIAEKHKGGLISSDLPKMHSGGPVLEEPTLKDDEVVRTLQVGERVLSKKDNQAFESFMPRFADLATKGSAMVPDFNPEIMAQTKTVIAETKQTSAQISEIKRTNELLVSVLTKMSNKGNDGITVVSTRMSDQEIIGALQRNPAALQALMGRNRNMGYR